MYENKRDVNRSSQLASMLEAHMQIKLFFAFQHFPIFLENHIWDWVATLYEDISDINMDSIVLGKPMPEIDRINR